MSSGRNLSLGNLHQGTEGLDILESQSNPRRKIRKVPFGHKGAPVALRYPYSNKQPFQSVRSSLWLSASPTVFTSRGSYLGLLVIRRAQESGRPGES